jgi:hypothetical protein
MMMFDPADPNSLNTQDMGIGKDLTGFIANMGNALKGTESLSASFLNTFKAIQDVDAAMSKIVTKLGTGAQNSEQIKESFGKAYSNVALFGGTFADLQTAQEEFLAINQRNVILSSENLTDLVAVTKVTGIAAKDLLTGFQNAGFSMASISKNMTEVNKISRNMGVNAQVVSSSVVSNLEKLNKFGFPNGVEGLAKMAAKAASLRIDMKSAFGVADDIFNRGPEAAIEISATLQRMGATSGALLDPLKLMDLAQNNIPELQNQLVDLSKQYTVFNEDTKQFEIMPGARKQLNEVAKSLGMSYDEFARMSLESSKMEKKLSEIDFNQLGLNNISEEDKTMIANMSEMNSGGEYTVKLKNEKTGEFEEKLLSQLNDDDLKQIQKGQLSDTEEMKNIAYDQLGLQGQMVAQQVALNNSISMLIATTDIGNDFLKVAQVTQTKNLGLEKTGEQQNTLDLLNANNKETVAALNMMGGDIQNLFNSLKGDDPAAMLNAFKSFGERFASVTGDVAKTQFQNLSFGDLMTTAVTKFATSADGFTALLDGLKKIIGVKDSIITPDGVVTPLEQDSIITMTQGEKFRDNLLGKGTPQPNQTAMIDKETMMSSPQSKNNTTNNSKIEIAFTHESKGANINVAQEFSKSLRDNTSLQQQLVQQISENIKNYGLTS